MRSCEVYFNKKKAGFLEEKSNSEYIFTYDPFYLEQPDAGPISLTLPLQQAPFTSEFLFSPFANMLSEGSNRKLQSSLFHLDEEDDFGILLESCQFDTIGAITVKPI